VWRRHVNSIVRKADEIKGNRIAKGKGRPTKTIGKNFKNI